MNYYKLIATQDGNYIGAKLGSYSIKLWNIKDKEQAPKCIQLSNREKIQVGDITFSPNNKHLAFSTTSEHHSGMSRFKLCNIDDKELAPFVELPVGPSTEIVYSPNGRYIAIKHWFADSYTLLFDTHDMHQEPRRIQGEHYGAIAFSADSRFFATTTSFDVAYHSTRHNAVIYDLESFSQISVLNDVDRCEDLMFLPKRDDFVYCSRGTVIIGNINGEQEKLVFDYDANSVSLASDEDLLAIATYGGPFIYDFNTKELKALSARSASKKCVFSPDGHYLLCNLTDKSIKVIDIAEPNNTMLLAGEMFKEIKFLASGKHFVTGSNKGIKIWNWQAMKQKMKPREDDERKD